MSNVHRTVFYVGVTNDLRLRIAQHKAGQGSIFIARYNCHHLLYFEEYLFVNKTIAREKQLKNWHRRWKINLIKQQNPDMTDLAADWF